MLGKDLKVTNIIKSAYNKDSGFVNREINAGHLLYDKKNPMEFRPHRALIAQGIPQSDSNNINQENENVNGGFFLKLLIVYLRKRSVKFRLCLQVRL